VSFCSQSRTDDIKDFGRFDEKYIYELVAVGILAASPTVPF
jgi:hypothetical protein